MICLVGMVIHIFVFAMACLGASRVMRLIFKAINKGFSKLEDKIDGKINKD